RPGAPPSRTPSTRRCGTGWPRSRTRTTASGRSSAPIPILGWCGSSSGWWATRPGPSAGRCSAAPIPSGWWPASGAAATPWARSPGSSTRRPASSASKPAATGWSRAGRGVDRPGRARRPPRRPLLLPPGRARPDPRGPLDLRRARLPGDRPRARRPGRRRPGDLRALHRRPGPGRVQAPVGERGDRPRPGTGPRPRLAGGGGGVGDSRRGDGAGDAVGPGRQGRPPGGRPPRRAAGMNLERHLRARREEGRKLLVPYVTGGLGSAWLDVVRAVADAGADAIEIGIPFSDPVMDGRIIQEASRRAIEIGATPAGIIADLAKVDVGVPTVVMTYYNPVQHYGHERFAASLAASGIDGAIIPDLPLDELLGGEAAGGGGGGGGAPGSWAGRRRR